MVSPFYSGDINMQDTVQSTLDTDRRPNKKAIDPSRIIIKPTSPAIQFTRFTGPEDAILTKQFSGSCEAG